MPPGPCVPLSVPSSDTPRCHRYRDAMRFRVLRPLAALLVALVLAGCSDEPDPADQADAADEPGEPPEATVTTVGDTEPGDAAGGWVGFESAEAGFRVELPVEPVRQEETLQGDVGTLQAVLFSASTGPDSSYSIAYTDYPEAVLQVDPGAVLDGVVQGSVTNASSTVQSSSKLSAEGFPAVDYVVNVEGGQRQVRAILVDRRIYLLQRAGPQPDEDGFRRMVDSFELINAPS